jgi:hypothetical protein
MGQYSRKTAPSLNRVQGGLSVHPLSLSRALENEGQYLFMTKLLSISVARRVWDATAIEYGLITTLIGLAAMIFFLAPLP